MRFHAPSLQPASRRLLILRLPRLPRGLFAFAVILCLSPLAAWSQNLIANGTYIIANKGDGDVIDVYQNSTTEGGLIDYYGNDGTNNQKWTLTNLGNNYVELISVSSGLALEVNGSSKATGASNNNIDQWPYGGGNNQRWQVVSEGSGNYELINENSGDALDLPSGSTYLDQWPSSGTANQLWSFTPTTANLISNGTYTIANKSDNDVIDVYENSTTEGGLIDYYGNDGTNNQKWTLTNLGNNYVELISASSGLALEVNGNSTATGASNNNIDQWPYGGGNNQRWQVVSEGGGYYELINENSGDALDLPSSSTYLDQWPPSGTANQFWSFTSTTASSHPGSTIAVNGSSNNGPISHRQLGVNGAFWASMDVKSTSPNGPAELSALGTKMLRWPGGSGADAYHWGGQYPYNNLYDPQQCNVTNSNTDPWTYDAINVNADNAWPYFQSYLAQAGGYETAVTVNYGTNATCNGSGDPQEAADWVANVKANGYNVTYWTVGNEEYGSWEDDLHPYSPASEYGGTGGHFASYYVGGMNGSSGWYQKMKAANSSAQIGAIIEIEGLNASDGWNAAVLGCSDPTGSTTCGSKTTGASFDFLEVHDYAQAPGQESDSYLLNGAITSFDSTISMLRQQLVATGHSVNTPIMLGEFNSVYGNQGKQTMSIVNALYIASMYGEVLTDGVNVATLWFGIGGNQGCGNNNSSSLYGWQNFGGYDSIANSVTSNWTNCGNGPNIPEGTVLPNGRAVYLANLFGQDGQHLLANSLGSSLSGIRAYSATNSTGYNHMLLNLNESESVTVTVNVSSPNKSSYTGTTVTYGKAQYDASQNNVWTAPVTQSLGTVGSTVTLTLPPYSITVLEMK